MNKLLTKAQLRRSIEDSMVATIIKNPEFRSCFKLSKRGEKKLAALQHSLDRSVQ